MRHFEQGLTRNNSSGRAGVSLLYETKLCRVNRPLQNLKSSVDVKGIRSDEPATELRLRVLRSEDAHFGSLRNDDDDDSEDFILQYMFALIISLRNFALKMCSNCRGIKLV